MKKRSDSQDILTEASEHTAERLIWFTARKDQSTIAQGIAAGKDLEEVYGLGDAELFDEFFGFLDEFKISDLFARLNPNSAKRSSNVSFHAVVLIYLMRIVCGLPFFWKISPVILQSQSLMRLVGFNGRQVRKGTSARGARKSKNNAQQDDAKGDDAKGETNLGEHSTIKSLAFDRGFIDGKFMWWLDQNGIVFQVPAKKKMDVYSDALSLVGTGARKVQEKKRYTGRGKTRKTVIDRWEVEGITGLTSAGFYGELGSGSHENRKDFVPNPLNAVVVLTDPFKVNNPQSDTMVILTNGDVKKNPMRTYNGYDERSEIENSMFREGKQSWFIERPAQNTESSFRAHVYLTIATIALTTAFRTWMDAEEKKEREGIETGIRKYREKIRQENGNKLIVFENDRYAVFDAYEVIILCGRTVRKPKGTKERITKEDILVKYQADRE